MPKCIRSETQPRMSVRYGRRPREGHGRPDSTDRLAAEGVEFGLRSQVEFVAHQGRRGENTVAKVRLVEDFRLVTTGLDHLQLAGQGGEVNSTVRRHRRGIIAAEGVEALLGVIWLAGARLE